MKFATGAGAIMVGSSPEDYTGAAARDIELLTAVAKRLSSSK